MDPVTVYYNPSCSKCRTAEGLLADAGIDAAIVRYLDQPPSVDDLRRLMGLLGITDPRDMLRRGEPVYAELDLDAASPDAVLAAVTAHPVLLERPIVVHDGRAVIARPPERIFEILGDGARTGPAGEGSAAPSGGRAPAC